MKYLDYNGLLYFWAKLKAYISTATVAAATKATQDASGNVITTTYATKTELPKIQVVTALPDTPDASTIYLIQGS